MNRDVPAELVRRQIMALDYAGYPTAALRQLELDDGFFVDKEIIRENITLELAGKVFHRCKTAMQDTTYGFEERAPEPQQQALMLFLSTLDCPTLGTMLTKQTSLVAYMQRGNEFALSLKEQQDQTLACAGFTRISQPSTVPQHYLAASDCVHLYWWFMSYSWLINQGINLHSVELMGDANVWSGLDNALAELFGCPVQFNAERFAIRFDAKYLQQPLHRNSADVEAMFRNIGKACAQIPAARNITARLNAMLAAPEGINLHLEQAAEQLHVSRQTLIRKLRGEGTSFKALKEIRQFDEAKHLLIATDMSLAAISDALGFANSPAFTRACKRWSQQSPSALRKQLRSS